MQLTLLVVALVSSFVGACALGVFFGFLMKNHHESPKLVGIGGGILFLLMLIPAEMAIVFFGSSKYGELIFLAALVLSGVMTITLMTTGVMYKLPIIGKPMLAMQVAMMRRQVEQGKVIVEKLERLEAEEVQASS